MEHEERAYQETEWNEEYREMRRVPRRRRAKRRSASGGERKASLLLAIQLSVCTAILAAVLLLRFVGGEWYSAVRSWYWEHLNSSIVAQEDWNEVETRILTLIPESGSSDARTQTSSSQAP